MNKYNTKQKDYSGCDNDIKDALMDDADILCFVSNSYDGVCDKVMITSFIPNISFKYVDDKGKVWDTAKPVKLKCRIKKLSEIIKWCEDAGWTLDDEGTFWNNNADFSFIPEMYISCGKLLSDIEDTWDWLPEWLDIVDETANT